MEENNLRYKRIMMLAILLVSLLAVSAVSAADNVTDDVVGVEETTDEVVSLDNDDQVILEETNVGTFTDLANEIAKSKGELNLNKNYKYASSDSSYKEGILIDKSIVINGNGHTINGNNKARIFNVIASDVVLNNINFENAIDETPDSYHGGAVYWNADYGVLANSSFLNCYSSEGEENGLGGGAVCWRGSYGVLANCSFVNSYSNDYYGGGAVYWHWGCDDCIIANCSFVNSYSAQGGGALYLNNNHCVVTNCNFVNSYSDKGYGGAVKLNGADDCVLSGCVFVNCSSVKSGGAVCWIGENGILSDCSFMNSYSDEGHGGAVYWSSDYGSLSNCSFMNSHVVYWYYGGAVYWCWELMDICLTVVL